MPDAPIGLLWDSVSNNIGDQAIGLTMKKFLENREFEFDMVNPFSYQPEDYSIMIVGGGELLRKKGDPFYDRFRVKGNHILNSVGTVDPDEIAYLDDYKLVSVRSEADKKFLEPVLNNVRVRPCTTILLEELYNTTNMELEFDAIIPRESIGIHFHLAMTHLVPSIIPYLEHLSQSHPLVLIPFTLYLHDELILDQLQQWLPNARILEIGDPISVFNAIGKMRAVVCSSLHATLFAYAQNIPILAYPHIPKIRYFLEERDLNEHIFSTGEDFINRLDSILDSPPDFSPLIAKDKQILHEHLDEIEIILRNSDVIEKSPSPTIDEYRRTLSLWSKTHHDLTMDNLQTIAQITAENLNLRRQIELYQNRMVVKIADSVQKLLDRLFPENSKRKKLLNAAKNFVRVLNKIISLVNGQLIRM